ncbi:hypothetical protein JRQ81_007943 [Phrynocephalus forsythii]|uniref:Uncharacterized protein n=1 Tax=Phrynocephalus forsythii TaxID=171643 RepID=A0A9Q0XEH2_9SAUR|nr:hypothetical protein JRQ81_007943 [Phrynocephalus forsythii]
MLLLGLMMMMMMMGLLPPREGGASAAGPEKEDQEAEGRPPMEPSRPYAVLKAQNLVLMGSVFSLLLVAMILMAVCVYKPLRRR